MIEVEGGQRIGVVLLVQDSLLLWGRNGRGWNAICSLEQGNSSAGRTSTELTGIVGSARLAKAPCSGLLGLGVEMGCLSRQELGSQPCGVGFVALGGSSQAAAISAPDVACGLGEPGCGSWLVSLAWRRSVPEAST